MRQKLRDIWDDSADEYAEIADDLPTYSITNKELVERADIKDGMNILDIACGTGLTSHYVLQRYRNVHLIGLDISEKQLRYASLRLKSYSHIRLIHENVMNIEERVKSGWADRMVCNAAIWQFENIDKVLSALRTVLDFGGTFTFSVPHDIRQEREDRLYYSNVFRVIDRNNWETVSEHTFIVNSSVPDVSRWLRIPAFRPTELQGLSASDTEEYARQHLVSGKTSRWSIFTIK